MCYIAWKMIPLEWKPCKNLRQKMCFDITWNMIQLVFIRACINFRKKNFKYFQPILCETITKSISKLPWNVYNCGETFAIKLIQGRPCMTQRDTGITMKDYREAEVLVHLNSTSIQYIAAYLIFNCLLGLSNAWKLESIKSIE